VEGLRQFIFCLLDLGLTAEEVAVMIRTNPAWLLGLDPPSAEPDDVTSLTSTGGLVAAS